MNEGSELVVVEQREVVFYGDTLAAVRGADGDIYAGLREMCQLLGIDTQGQRQRISRHGVLGEGLRVCKLHTPQGRQTGHVLRVDLVPLWLSGVRAAVVREDARPRLERFQREAARVLWEAFREGRLTSGGDEAADILAGVSPETAQAVQLAQAVLMLARNQAAMEKRLGGRVEAVEGRLDDALGRLETVEATLGDAGRYVTPDQASQLSQAVKAVALAVGRSSGRNEHGAVYGEMYRKFGITGYKMLPARRFDEAMRWLTEWHESAAGGPLPF